MLHEGPAAYCDLVKLNNKQVGVLDGAGSRSTVKFCSARSIVVISNLVGNWSRKTSAESQGQSLFQLVHSGWHALAQRGYGKQSKTWPRRSTSEAMPPGPC